MNKYVVAFFSEYTGVIYQEIVAANSALAAGISYLDWWAEAIPPKTLEELYKQVEESGCAIHVLDLNKALKTNRSGGGGINAPISVPQIQ